MKELFYSVGLSLPTIENIRTSDFDEHSLAISIEAIRNKSVALSSRSDAFIKMSPKELLAYYPKSNDGIFEGLPYSEAINWRSIGQAKLRLNPSQFRISHGNGVWNAVRHAGFEKRKSTTKRLSDGPAIRLKSCLNNVLEIQPATYFDQAKSNLIIDYAESTSPEGNLRSLLMQEYGNALPPLSDPRMANTVGIAAIVLIRTREGYRPYMRIRDGEALGYPTSGIHLTASAVAKWPTSEQSTMDPFAYFDDQMYARVCKDLGLPVSELSPQKNSNTPLKLYPVSLCREFQRAGKPQIFYIGVLDMSLKEIRDAREENFYTKKFFKFEDIQVEEKYILESIWASKTDEFTPEGAAGLALLQAGLGF